MSKPTAEPNAFPTIESDALEAVTGGRWIPRKGLDPAVTTGMKSLAEAVGQAGQVMTQKKAESAQQMQQVVSQMMQKRG